MSLSSTRTDLTAEDLRRVARTSRSVGQARPCLPIASVLEGRRRGDAAEAAGMQRQTPRGWVHRYDAEGVAGLVDRPTPLRARLLSPDPLAAYDKSVGEGPEVAVEGGVRWRRIGLKPVVERRSGMMMVARTAGDPPLEQGFRAAPDR